MQGLLEEGIGERCKGGVARGGDKWILFSQIYAHYIYVYVDNSLSFFAESFAGSNLARIDPAK